MIRLTLACSAAVILLATAVTAENLRIYRVQEDGGVTVTEGKIDAEAGAVALGLKTPPEGTTGIVFEDGEPPKWTSRSDQDVNEEYGGQGEPLEHMEFTEEEVAANEEMTFQEDEGTDTRTSEVSDANDASGTGVPSGSGTDDDEMTFDPGEGTDASGAKIVLEGGTWFSEVTSADASGCPAQVKSTVDATIAAMNGSVVEAAIGAGFHPRQYAPQFTWEETGANSWAGILDQRTGEGVGVTVQFWIIVRAPDLIENRQVVSFYLPGATCRSDVKFFWHKP